MGRKRDTIRLAYQVIVAATGTGMIKSKPVESGTSLVVQSIAFRNQTGTRGSAVLAIGAGSDIYPLIEEPAPTANEWWTYDIEQHLREGEVVRVDQATCTASDILDLVIIGYVEYLKELKE